MAISKEKRKKMEELIYATFTALDPTKTNTTKYKLFFQDMTDAQFDSFFKKFFASDNEYLVLDVVDYERDLKMQDIEKAAKIVGSELYDYVALPYRNMDKEHPVITKFKVPVGYAPIKRVQQMVAKKNTSSIDISQRSATTGQVTGKDKNARDNDTECFALVTLGATETLKEFQGPRADDLVMKTEMYNQIATNGYVDLNKLTNKVENKTTLNTIDTYLTCMGIKSDLVTDGLLLKKTLRD
jgi:hypothetical protein